MCLAGLRERNWRSSGFAGRYGVALFEMGNIRHDVEYGQSRWYCLDGLLWGFRHKHLQINYAFTFPQYEDKKKRRGYPGSIENPYNFFE